ncbi:hypothetical protein [Williamsia serinedens]|uniref:Uncharacterized protein n=1 Tax=Williamsia serinedens TaxID=391736 RepID=A0ABT1H8V1_9NOCA|nr:hypothetical protein [Williamsia serinedens]MCP2163038.1 hypothetical protein [Williamsia serinedens]
MICWSVTAFTATHPDDGILTADAATSLTDARLAAGEVAIAALDDLAGRYPDSPPFLSISIDDAPVLVAAAGKTRAGGVDFQTLIDQVEQMRRTVGVLRD